LYVRGRTGWRLLPGYPHFVGEPVERAMSQIWPLVWGLA
jgi:hypothetical protein